MPKLALAGVTLLLLWGGGFALFAFGGALIPLFTPSLTFAGSAGISGALMSQFYRQKKQYAEAMVQRAEYQASVEAKLKQQQEQKKGFVSLESLGVKKQPRPSLCIRLCTPLDSH